MADKYVNFSDQKGDVVLIKALQQGDGSYSLAMGDRDNSTDALMIIDYAHHEVHAGRHFMYTDATTIAAAASQAYLITTPDTTRWAHMIFHLDGSAITQWILYEGADRTGITTAATGNNNRNSSLTAGVLIHKGTTGGTTDGTALYTYKGGSATNQARGDTGAGNAEEIILEQDTKYILLTKSYTNDNLTNVRLEWYEHIDKA